MNTHHGSTKRGPTGYRPVLKNIGLFLMSTVAALAVGEVIVRLAIPVRNVGPTFSEYDPVYGKRLKKSFTCTRIADEFTMRFSTNSLGFRGPEPTVFPSGGVVFLGDSFTSGYGVNDGEEFPDLIRRTLLERFPADPPPVVNAGSGNTGNGYWIRFLRNEAARFAPRALVLGFCINDFEDNIVDGMFTVDGTGGLVESTAAPRQEGARTAQAVIEAIPGLAYSHLVGLARQVFSEGMTAPSAADVPPWRDTLTYAMVQRSLQMCRERAVPAILLTIEVDPPRLERLRAIALREGARIVVAPSKQDRPDLYFATDGHWNADGHRVVARIVADTLLTAVLH